MILIFIFSLFILSIKYMNSFEFYLKLTKAKRTIDAIVSTKTIYL